MTPITLIETVLSQAER